MNYEYGLELTVQSIKLLEREYKKELLDEE